ncbi:MAG: hypothetical protein ACRC20_11095 [Segniliparus sp.]|uniref:hypothetical protein n=1 Tax=Segniliparus sp. TaxID=2804064 RepID=UPI003F2C1353
MPTSDLPGDGPDDRVWEAGRPSGSFDAERRQDGPFVHSSSSDSPLSPFSLEALALLHADALEGAERDRVRAGAAADPAAQAVLAGLDRVCEQLRKLDQSSAPSEPMPEFVARRMDRELAKLSGVADGHRRRWSTAASVGSVAAAAAVLSLVTYVAWPRPGQNEQRPSSQAEPAPATQGSSGPTGEIQPTVVDNRFKIERKDFSALMGSRSSIRDLGPLSDDVVRGGCLAANGFPANQQIAAVGRIRRGDREGIFMMIPTPSARGGAPEMTVLVVGAECSAGVPATLSKQILSRN